MRPVGALDLKTSPMNSPVPPPFPSAAVLACSSLRPGLAFGSAASISPVASTTYRTPLPSSKTVPGNPITDAVGPARCSVARSRPQLRDPEDSQPYIWSGNLLANFV